MMRTVALLLMTACALSAIGQTLDINPNTVTGTISGFQADVKVVLHNTTAQKLYNVSLSGFSNDGITLGNIAPVAEVPANGMFVWPIQITVPASSHLPGVVTLQGSFQVNGAANVIFAKLDVKADGVQKPVEVSLDGTTEPISQQRPGRVNVVVTNNLDVEIAVTAGSQSEGNGLKILPVVGTWTIPPHSVAARPLEMTTGFRVTPGAQNVIVDVDTQWIRDGQTSKRHFALTRTVTVGIFFESEILKALSVPSFLALPGCLFLFTLQFLLSTGWMGVKNESSLPQLSITSPGFWLISLSLSSVMLLLYYCVTGVNCLETYGAVDIGWIWVSSIVIGALTFILYAGARRRWRREHVMTSSDKPMDVLVKLSRNQLPLVRPALNFKLNSAPVMGLTLETIADDQTFAWVAPPIQVFWKAVSEPEEKKASQDAQGEFRRIMNGDRSPAALVELLKAAESLVELQFNSTPAFPGRPYHLKMEAVTGPAAEQLMVT